MSDLNRVVLTGRLTRDPEMKALPDGTPVLAIRLAFSTRKRDAQGQWGDVSNFIDVSMFGSRAESLSRLLEKGRLIGVDGKLRWREWENDGQKRSAIDITADNIELLGGRTDGTGSGQGGYAAPASGSTSAPAAGGSETFEEDIPF
jgi:single-strand DNA-binding protein